MSMILVNPNVTELSAGYVVIREFIDRLESTWLPGFERSYLRRTEEYQKALEKYEERGLFLRTLLKKPKQPKRPPAGYKEDTATRLYGSWLDSFRVARGPAGDDFLDLLYEVLDDSFYVVSGLQLQPDLSVPAATIGPSGIFLFVEAEEMWEGTAAVVKELLPGPNQADIPILGGNLGTMQSWLAGIDNQNRIDQRTIFTIIDPLLAHQQEIKHAHTFSALSAAEKLAKLEKDNLLRMAATL